MQICRDFTGATGLEPATSGVTDRRSQDSVTTPSLATEGVSLTPVRATPTGCLQALFGRSSDSSAFSVCRQTRACPRVLASRKMYPSRTREESKSRHYRQHNMPICRAFSKPSDGLEPSTPSLPWRFGASRAYTCDHSRHTFSSKSSCRRTVEMRRETSRVSFRCVRFVSALPLAR